MRPARFRQADFSLVKIDNAKSMSPAVSSGRSAGSFPEQRLVIEPSVNGTKSCRRPVVSRTVLTGPKGPRNMPKVSDTKFWPG